MQDAQVHDPHDWRLDATPRYEPVEAVPPSQPHGDESPPPATPKVNGDESLPPATPKVQATSVKPAKSNSPVVEKPAEAPQEALSTAAIEKRLRRVMTPRADGSYLVGPDFVKQFATKGADRDALFVMFEKCNYDPDKGYMILFL